MPPKEVKPRDQLTKKDLTCRSWYQEGFSKEGAKLLARLWIKQDTQTLPTDETG
jgi:hypothetical protein